MSTESSASLASTRRQKARGLRPVSPLFSSLSLSLSLLAPAISSISASRALSRSLSSAIQSARDGDGDGDEDAAGSLRPSAIRVWWGSASMPTSGLRLAVRSWRERFRPMTLQRLVWLP